MHNAAKEVINTYYTLRKLDCRSHTCGMPEAKKARLKLDNAIKYLEAYIKSDKEEVIELTEADFIQE